MKEILLNTCKKLPLYLIHKNKKNKKINEMKSDLFSSRKEGLLK